MTINSKVKIEDFSKVIKSEIKAKTLRGLARSKDIIKNRVYVETPYRTGKLRRSNNVLLDREEMSLRIETGGKGARHANLIIYGTPYNPPNDYLERTANKTKRTIRENLKRNLTL